MSELAEHLWGSFLDDMFGSTEIPAFHNSVDSGDTSIAHGVLFAWMLGYQESAELSEQDQADIEKQLDAYIAEHRAEQAEELGGVNYTLC